VAVGDELGNAHLGGGNGGGQPPGLLGYEGQPGKIRAAK
jgi:hypothetical protein